MVLQNFFDIAIKNQAKFAIDNNDPKLLQIILGSKNLQLDEYWVSRSMMNYNILSAIHNTQYKFSLEILDKAIRLIELHKNNFEKHIKKIKELSENFVKISSVIFRPEDNGTGFTSGKRQLGLNVPDTLNKIDNILKSISDSIEKYQLTSIKFKLNEFQNGIGKPSIEFYKELEVVIANIINNNIKAIRDKLKVAYQDLNQKFKEIISTTQTHHRAKIKTHTNIVEQILPIKLTQEARDGFMSNLTPNIGNQIALINENIIAKIDKHPTLKSLFELNFSQEEGKLLDKNKWDNILHITPNESINSFLDNLYSLYNKNKKESDEIIKLIKTSNYIAGQIVETKEIHEQMLNSLTKEYLNNVISNSQNLLYEDIKNIGLSKAKLFFKNNHHSINISFINEMMAHAKSKPDYSLEIIQVLIMNKALLKDLSLNINSALDITPITLAKKINELLFKSKNNSIIYENKNGQIIELSKIFFNLPSLNFGCETTIQLADSNHLEEFRISTPDKLNSSSDIMASSNDGLNQTIFTLIGGEAEKNLATKLIKLQEFINEGKRQSEANLIENQANRSTVQFITAEFKNKYFANQSEEFTKINDKIWQVTTDKDLNLSQLAANFRDYIIQEKRPDCAINEFSNISLDLLEAIEMVYLAIASGNDNILKDFANELQQKLGTTNNAYYIELLKIFNEFKTEFELVSSASGFKTKFRAFDEQYNKVISWSEAIHKIEVENKEKNINPDNIKETKDVGQTNEIVKQAQEQASAAQEQASALLAGYKKNINRGLYKLEHLEEDKEEMSNEIYQELLNYINAKNPPSTAINEHYADECVTSKSLG